MNSLLFLHENADRIQSEIDAFTKKKQIHPHDIFIVEPVIEKTSKKTEPTSIGIEVIKKLRTTLFLKPSQSPEKAVIIPKAHLLTVPAQNALLKVLEEPPAATYIVLTGSSEDAFLPTILSRCSIITLSKENLPVEEETKKQMQKEYAQLFSLPLSTLLKKADSLSKNKLDALEYLKQITVVAREELLKNVSDTSVAATHLSSLTIFTQTHKLLQLTNSNLRLTLEQCFLSFTR